MPFECNIKDAHERKSEKYADLVNELKEKGFNAKLFCIEIGSRGYISKENVKCLKCMFHHFKSNLGVQSIRTSLCKTAIVGSFIVYYSKYDPNWTDPSFVRF